MGLKKIEHCVLEIHYIIRHEDFIEIGSHLAQITFDHSWHCTNKYKIWKIILTGYTVKAKDLWEPSYFIVWSQTVFYKRLYS